MSISLHDELFKESEKTRKVMTCLNRKVYLVL